MDVTGTFFNKLRTLAVTLEKQADHFKQILLEDEEFEDDSPMRYLHELYSEARILKADADNILHTSSSERDATYDFIKASKVLMKRNATNLEKIRHLFQKYGHKPLIGKNEAIKVDDEINDGSALSDQIEPKPDFLQTSSGSHSLLKTPQLSDFGLSKYAFPSSSDTIHIPHSQKEDVKGDTSEYLLPKVEYFNIHGRDLSVNDETINLMDDQTIFLLNKARKNRCFASHPRSFFNYADGGEWKDLYSSQTAGPLHSFSKWLRPPGGLSLPSGSSEGANGSARVMISNQNLAALRQSNEVCGNDCFTSPAAPKFCTPGVKIPHRKTTVLSESPESNHLDVPKHTTELPPLDTKPQQIQPLHVSAPKILPDNNLIKDNVQPVLDSDKYLECTEEPSPPAMSVYEDLFSSLLPPPEITVIPNNLLQILSRYNPNIKVPKSAAKGTKENVSQFEEKLFLCTDNKENRKYSG